MTALKETVIDFTIPWSEGSGWSLLYRKTKPRRFVLTTAPQCRYCRDMYCTVLQGHVLYCTAGTCTVLYCRDMYWFLHSMNWNSWGSVLSCILGTVALVYLFERFEKKACYIRMSDAQIHYSYCNSTIINSMFRISPSSYEVIDDEAEVCRKM